MQNSKLNTITFFSFLFLNMVISRFFVNISVSYDMSEKSPSMLLHLIYLGTLVSIAFIITLIILKNKKIKKNFILFYFILFYLYATFHSFLSLDFMLSLYTSLEGILYIFEGLFLLHIIREMSIDKQVTFVKKLTLIFFVFGFIASFIVSFRSLGIEAFTFGSQGGMYALFGYMYILIELSQKRKNYLKLFIIFSMSIMMNSVSSLSVFIISFLFLGNKNKFSFFFLLLSLSLIIILLLNYDLSTIKFANKDMDTILEGTGRFLIYMHSWEIIQGFEQGFLGVGLNAEYKLLDNFEDLIWSHTAHNSFLTVSIGLGVAGIFSYLIMIILVVKIVRYKKEEYFYLNILILMCFLYGVTNAVFPGKPGLLIPYSILVYQVIINIRRKDEYIL